MGCAVTVCEIPTALGWLEKKQGGDFSLPSSIPPWQIQVIISWWSGGNEVIIRWWSGDDQVMIMQSSFNKSLVVQRDWRPDTGAHQLFRHQLAGKLASELERQACATQWQLHHHHQHPHHHQASKRMSWSGKLALPSDSSYFATVGWLQLALQLKVWGRGEGRTQLVPNTNTNTNTNPNTNTTCEAEEKEGHSWFQIAVFLLEQTHLQSALMSVLHLWQISNDKHKNKNKEKYMVWTWVS